jgi:peptidyl-prolyl cis-trans isomerase D
MLRRREASALAQKDGMAKLEQLRKGESAGLNWGAPRTVSRRESKGLSPDLLRHAVAADVSKLPAYVGVPSQEGGYVLLRISKVTEAAASEQPADAGQRAAAVVGAAQYQAFVASLRSRADIEMKSLTPAGKK